MPTQVYAFTTGLEGFTINYYCSGAAPVVCQTVTAGAAAPADAGADSGAPAAPIGNDFYALSHDPAVGQPDLGSLRLEVQFTGLGQLAELALNVPTVDLTGKTITAQVRVEAGAPPTTNAKMYVKTGMAYLYADSGQVPLVPGSWVTLRYTSSAAAFADVREMGIEFGIGATETAFSPAVLHVDTFQY